METKNILMAFLLVAWDLHVMECFCHHQKYINGGLSPVTTIVIGNKRYFKLNHLFDHHTRPLHSLLFIPYNCFLRANSKDFLLNALIDKDFVASTTVLQVFLIQYSRQLNQIVADTLLAFEIPLLIIYSPIYGLRPPQKSSLLNKGLYPRVVFIPDIRYEDNAELSILHIYNLSNPAFLYQSEYASERVYRQADLMKDHNICSGPLFPVTNSYDISQALSILSKRDDVQMVYVYINDLILLHAWGEEVLKRGENKKTWIFFNNWIKPIIHGLFLINNINVIAAASNFRRSQERLFSYNKIKTILRDALNKDNIYLFSKIDKRKAIVESVQSQIVNLMREYAEESNKPIDYSSESVTQNYLYFPFRYNWPNVTKYIYKLVHGKVCKRSCSPGYSSALARDSKCCFMCIKCKKHYQQPKYGRYNCTECHVHETSSRNHSSCIPLSKVYIKLSQTKYIAITLILSLSGLLMTAVILFILLKYSQTPVVRSSNMKLSIIQVSLHGCNYMTPLLYFINNTIVRNVSYAMCNGVLFSFVLSIYLVKTFKLLYIFKSRVPIKRVMMFKAKEISIILAVVTTNVVIGIYSYVTLDENILHWRDDTKNVYYETQTTGYLFYVEISSMSILSFICGLYSYKLRNLPSNYNEGKFIAPAMFTLTFTLWATFIVYDIYVGKEELYIATIVMMFFGNTSLLLITYAYKIYVIMFLQYKNTKEYFNKKRLFQMKKRDNIEMVEIK